jgi:hypothetical protein
MNRALSNSFDNLWSAAGWPMWLTIAAVLLIGGLVVVLAFRAEKSAANGALAILTVVAIVTSAILLARGSGGSSRSTASIADTRQPAQITASLPALSCLDGIAGESVESACEKAIFTSAESVAAAVSYSGAQISRLASFGNVATANKAMTPELNALRRTVERDRFGMIAHVLMTREGCTLSVCPFFASLTNTARISLNMNERLYDGFIGNYAPAWNAPVASTPAVSSPVAALPPTAPTGKPVSGDFPTAASIPPVNIMTPEPAAQGSAQSPSPNARAPDTSPASARAQTPPQAPKKSAAQKSRAQAPTSLAPSQADDDN